LAFDSNKAYEFSDDGLILPNGVHLISGSASPNGLINPSVESRYLQTDGTLWYHDGVSGINGWTSDLVNVLTGLPLVNAPVIQTDSVKTAIGKLQSQIASGLDYHSGYNTISSAETIQIQENKQSINFTELTLDGDLTMDGDLWLA